MSLTRITYVNYPHLVIVYANDGLILFKDNEDYEFYIKLLKELVKENLIKVYSFCLTSKEIRIVIKPLKINLSKIMQKIHAKFSKYINKKFQHKGAIFKSRYFSLLFLDKHLLEIIRSVHLWPVRARLVKRAELYEFSSQKIYVGEKIWDFISYEEVLSSLGNKLENQKKSYNKFLEQAILEPDNIGISYSSGMSIDEESFNEFSKKIDIKKNKECSIDNLAKKTCLILGISPQDINCKSRQQNLVMARRMLATVCVLGFGVNASRVAEYLQLDKAQVSRLISQGIQLLNNHQPFINIFTSVTKDIL